MRWYRKVEYIKFALLPFCCIGCGYVVWLERCFVRKRKMVYRFCIPCHRAELTGHPAVKENLQ